MGELCCSEGVDSMKNYHATVRIKNGRVMWAMKERGIKTVSELARMCNCSPVGFYKLLNLHGKHRLKDGSFSLNALRIAEALDMPPDALFIDEYEFISETMFFGFVDQEQLSMATGGENALLGIEQAEIKDALKDALLNLKPREEDVIRRHFIEGEGLSEIGNDYGLSRERIKQIHDKGLRKLRHPANINRLNDFRNVEVL